MKATTDSDLIETPADPASYALARTFIELAAIVGDVAMAHRPRELRQRVRHAVDHDGATISVQVTLPSGDVGVLADGPGWAQPVTLLALAPTDTLPDFVKIAMAIVNHGLASVAPDARRRLLAALDRRDATAAVVADLPGCTIRVLVHADGWAEHEEVFCIELPSAPAVTLN